MLQALEEGERAGGGNPRALIDDLPLFSATPAPAPAPKAKSAAEDRLRDVLPDELTPKQALDLLYELKRLADG